MSVLQVLLSIRRSFDYLIFNCLVNFLQTLYDAWFITFYNVCFTSLPVLALGILDKVCVFQNSELLPFFFLNSNFTSFFFQLLILGKYNFLQFEIIRPLLLTKVTLNYILNNICLLGDHFLIFLFIVYKFY